MVFIRNKFSMNISELIKKHLNKVVKEQEDHISQDGTYMVLSNLIKIKRDIETILSFKHKSDFPKLVTGEHAWAGDHITTSADDIEEVANFMEGYFEQKNLNEVNQKNKSIAESHFKVGDKVKMSHGGVGVVKSLDKEDGSDGEKYYNIKLPNGDVMKHAPNELTKESFSESAMDDVDFIGGQGPLTKREEQSISNFIKAKNESMESEIYESKNTPTNSKLWAASLAWARSRYDVCPSAYCNGAASKHYKSKGGRWRKSK